MQRALKRKPQRGQWHETEASTMGCERQVPASRHCASRTEHARPAWARAGQLAHRCDAFLLASIPSAEGAQTTLSDRLDCSDRRCVICSRRAMQSVPGWWRVARPLGRSPAINAASKIGDCLLNPPIARRAATPADHRLRRPLCKGPYSARAQQYGSDATACRSHWHHCRPFTCYRWYTC